MSIIDRYITRQFLLNFAILLAVFVTLFVLADVVIDLDEFLAAGQARAARADGGNLLWHTLIAIIDFDGPMLVLLYVFFAGLLVVGAAGFTFVGLTRSREMVAMVASGISLHRVAMPVLVVGGLLNALTILNQELLIPQLSEKLVRAKRDMRKLDGPQYAVLFVPDGRGSLFSAGEFRPQRGELVNLTIIVRNEHGRETDRVTATQAIWQDEPQGWELIDGYLETRADLAGAAGPQSQVTPVEFFPTDLSPRILQAQRAALYASLLDSVSLRALIKSDALEPAQKDRLRQIMHSRFSLMVLNVLVLVIGLPFFLMLAPVNITAASIKAAGVCVAAWSLGLVLVQIGPVGFLNPVTTAWLPVALYLPLSMFMLQRVKT